MRFLLPTIALSVISASADAAPATRAVPVGPHGLVDLITSEDYPPPALRDAQQGIARIRLDVGVDGRVERCTVIGSTNSPSLDSTSCRLMQERARFTPARDRKGRTVPDSVTTSVTWRLAEPAYAPAIREGVRLYLACLGEAVRPLVAGSATDDAVADQAFASCTTEEQALLAIVAGAPGGTDVTSEHLRLRVRPGLVKAIRTLREARPSR